MNLSNKQKQHLKGLAHALKPVVQLSLIIDAIVRETGAIKVNAIGHVVVLFKQSDEKKVELPKR